MRSTRVYIAGLDTKSSNITIKDQTARHLIKVLRLKPGSEIMLFDGDNHEYQGTISAVTQREVEVEIFSSSPTTRESPLNISLFQGMARGERMDWVLQKATELGVSQVTPVFTSRSTIKLDDKRIDKRMDHWRSIVINACEQCGRNRLPRINLPVGLPEALQQLPSGMNAFQLDPDAKTRFTDLESPRTIGLFIGPEGGFAEDEKQLMSRSGVTSIRFGPRILRTETAGIAAISAIGALWGDL